MTFSRREFLTGLALGLAALTTPALATADLLTDANGAPLPDYDGRTLQGRPERQPQYVEGVLNLKSGHTGERYRFAYRDTQGNYDPQILLALSWFMRCYSDRDAYVSMDLRVIEMVNYLAKWFPGNPEITITSAYRTPYYNRMIAKSNENVAKNSLHMAGRAIDFSIPGIPIRQVCQVALAVRNMAGSGGVGYYPRQGFVHLDCGDRASTWVH
jgi:uncharacterized protein YcbK (DUF882 family)